ncbi:uncharacterized protein LOC103480152 isoform X1 [Poecilia reticulata]|uniref:uncharacterized protein LOC103480152 isoform X1 n=1 Tax=Poecilia reticulata TaxID=8081 RepID=UPI0004A2638B|nr:PREDICTED: uncharacterized protein LOC103480152 isoform X1 [Poecilia reticulata]
MTPPAFALYLVSLLVVILAHKPALTHLSLLMESSEVGGSATLQCLCWDDAALMFYWYKQTQGKEPRLVCTFYKHSKKGRFEDEFDTSRFSLDSENHSNILLNISDLRMSDSATYYCIKSNLADFKFCVGTTLIVKGSGLNLPTSLKQSETEPIRSLNCSVQTGSCGAEHSFYWFRNSGEFQPGLIYSQAGDKNQCERKRKTSTNSCTFNLPMENLNKSQNGADFCAVASCGHILFGDESIVHSEGDSASIVLVYLLSGALSFTTLLAATLAFSVLRLSKRHSQQTDGSDTFYTRNALTAQVRIILWRIMVYFCFSAVFSLLCTLSAAAPGWRKPPICCCEQYETKHVRRSEGDLQ